MKAGQIALVILLSLVTSVIGAGYVVSQIKKDVGMNAQAKESAYDRVMRTGTLRCGYILYPKIVERDPNSGALSGLYYDLMEKIGQELSLKIDWTEETALSLAFNGLNAGRYDAMCFPFSQTAGRARVTEFTRPVMFVPQFIYARADDTRFDNAYDKINAPTVKVAFLEGEVAQYVKAELFPKAETVSLPNFTDPSQAYLQVSMNKADIVMAEPSSIEPFLLHNPGKLKRVSGPSLRMQATGLDVAIGEERLKALLDTAILALDAIGYTHHLIDAYTTGPDQFYYAANPWGDGSKPALNN